MRGLLWAALAALLLQSLYPPGLMPGQLDDGWVASLCPQGLPMGFAHRLGLHEHHHDGHEESRSLGDCQLGNAVEQPLVDAVPALLALQEETTALLSPPRVSVAAIARSRFHDTRAPPLSA